MLAAVPFAAVSLWYRYGIRDTSQQAAPGFKSEPVAAAERINILVLGMDDEGLRSDTVMVASFDAQTRSVGLLSIPRDSRVRVYTAGPDDVRALAGTDLSRSGYDKINAATAYRSKVMAGIPRSMRTVEQLLAVPIHYYVRIRLDGFVSLVDRLGGIDFDVPQNMNYDDPTQNLHIHLKKGPQHLNGKQALELVRYRGYYGGTPERSDDLGRIHVQQGVIQAILERMESTGAILKLPSLAGDLARAVDTNLPASRLLALATAAADIRPDQVRMGVLPGHPVGVGEGFDRDYYLPDMTAAQPLIDSLLRGVGPDSRSQV
ncbi:MAG: LCP family protein [Bacillota bacterium]